VSEPLKVLDLFSGIGGFSLGLERTGGFKTVAFCETEEFPRRVLTKHWPGVPIHQDVRSLRGSDVEAVDAICGGFPCQDISFAGKGAGIEGERSGLWREYARLVGEIRPRFVIVENVAALLGRGIHVVLGDLAALGYDAVWHCIPASAVGAPHRRDRLWIIAYARGEQHEVEGNEVWRKITARLHEALADAMRCGQSGPGRPVHASDSAPSGNWQVDRTLDDRGWPAEPDVGRVAYGVPFGVERLTGLGNAVVPQIPEIIGRAILAAEATP
jgi:DNA (cytosine-5)-methyltransferase 1